MHKKPKPIPHSRSTTVKGIKRKKLHGNKSMQNILYLKWSVYVILKANGCFLRLQKTNNYLLTREKLSYRCKKRSVVRRRYGTGKDSLSFFLFVSQSWEMSPTLHLPPYLDRACSGVVKLTFLVPFNKQHFSSAHTFRSDSQGSKTFYNCKQIICIWLKKRNSCTWTGNKKRKPNVTQ